MPLLHDHINLHRAKTPTPAPRTWCLVGTSDINVMSMATPANLYRNDNPTEKEKNKRPKNTQTQKKTPHSSSSHTQN
jgi:hypothetical protein